MTVVKLKLRRQSNNEFLVILTAAHRQDDIEGILPPLPTELESSFKEWQYTYRCLEDVRSYFASTPGERPHLRLTPKSVTIHSHENLTQAVKTSLNQWLNSGDSKWQPIRDELIAIAQQLGQVGNEIRVILDVKDINLRRLPWQEWKLFEDYYPQAEIALSAPKGATPTLQLPQSRKVRVLVAVGRSDGISTQDDLQIIKRLEEMGAEVVCLMQPELKTLCEALWDNKGYHILIFTGHSGSDQNGQIGWIEVNEQENLSIDQFKLALKEAISKGLQLAIFNSCDGLGLANQLAELHLPQSIVMREPVPDAVAVEFLKHFFQEFTHHQSLFASVQQARKRLEPFKSRYPGAVWLPTICIAPNVEPVTWQSLCHRDKSEKPVHPEPTRIPRLLLAGLLGVCLGWVMTIPIVIWMSKPSTSAPQPVETRFDGMTAPSGTWLYGGSTTWAPIRGVVDQKIKQQFPKFQLIYSQHPTLPPGSGTGIKMLLDGQLSFAQSSRPINDREYDLAVARGVKLKQVPVAIDAIAVVVHPDLPIQGLTIAQLRDIYNGKITNWRLVGGPNLEIIPYSRPLDSGTTEFFRENILGSNQAFGNNVVFIPTTTQTLNLVGKSSHKGGIYFASAPEVLNQCLVKTLSISRHQGSTFVTPGTPIPGKKLDKNCRTQYLELNLDALQNGEYTLTRRLFVVIKQNEQFDERAGEAYAKLLLTDQGQNLIQKAGFIPIR